jgi:predicted NBD/HSP70 family sugar kinase
VTDGLDGRYRGPKVIGIGDVRQHNQALLLELVRTRGPISRAELRRIARLSMPSVMDITRKLIKRGLIRETGEGPSTGGRPPVLLAMIPEAHCAVGLEIGTQTIVAVVTDMAARVRLRLKAPSRMSEGQESVVEQVDKTLKEVFRGISDDVGSVLGIGLALPAPIIPSVEEAIFSPPSYPGWGQLRLDLQLGRLMDEEYGVPLLVDNDANAAALGEHLFGAGRGTQDMFYMIVHRGVGGAAMLNGQLYRGADGGAGEVGHTMIDPNGPRCGCGRFGCLEAFVGRAAIARRAREVLKRAGEHELEGRNVDEIDADDLIEAALKGHSLAGEVLEEVGTYLGYGMANVVNSFNPCLLVVGGSSIRAGSYILEPAVKTMRRRALSELGERVRVVTGELGEDAGAVGAAALVLREVFVVSVPQNSSLEHGVYG